MQDSGVTLMQWYDYAAMAFLFSALAWVGGLLIWLLKQFGRFLELYLDHRRAVNRQVEELTDRIRELEASSPYVQEHP